MYLFIRELISSLIFFSLYLNLYKKLIAKIHYKYVTCVCAQLYLFINEIYFFGSLRSRLSRTRLRHVEIHISMYL